MYEHMWSEDKAYFKMNTIYFRVVWTMFFCGCSYVKVLFCVSWLCCARRFHLGASIVSVIFVPSSEHFEHM